MKRSQARQLPLVAMLAHPASVYPSVIQHRIHVDFMGVALNEERNLPTIEEVKERLLDAGNI